MNWFLKEQSIATKSAVAMMLLALFVGGAFVIGVNVGSSGGRSSADSSSLLFSGSDALQPVGVDFSPLWKAWNTINNKFVPVSTSTKITDADKVWGMVSGLAGSLEDPYTVFLPPADSEIFEDDISGNFEGVGMEIGMRNNILTVIAPLKGTPADRAGIMSGDSILRIDKEPTDNLTIDEAVKRIRGERGTPIIFTIARDGEGEFLEIEVIRDIIEIPTIQTELRDDGIFVINLFNFSALSPNLFRQALREFVLTGSNKLILDLRGNPGGFLEAAVDMASWFLPTGEVVLREDFGRYEKLSVYRSKGYDIFNENLKMVILINRGSASASEILAGALQEHGIAMLVGEKSFGKGSVQELVKITPDTSLKITIARWLTPNSVSISDGGLTPDIEVSITPEDFEAEIDTQLDKAVEILDGS
ncbi:S41 family peptidase [Patescibacteria group bacterium]|nr:S41 family peptidase [Patescibacteria group bacterium]